MKKYVALAVAVLVFLFTAGCAGEHTQPSEPPVPETTLQAAAESDLLTPEELSWFCDYTNFSMKRYDEERDGMVTVAAPISCFFTSVYDDVRDMDAEAFLRYCSEPADQKPVDAEEFGRIQEVLDWRGEDGHLLAFEELPVPCHRLPRTYLNEILTQYASVTVEEMHTNWMEEALYVAETDCFYTFTSDFAPGAFFPCRGEKNGDVVTLWDVPAGSDGGHVLTLQKSGETWLVLSYQSVEHS